MRVGLLTDLGGQRTWHLWLSRELQRRGHEFVVLRPSDSGIHGAPAALQLALWLDPLWFRLGQGHAFQSLAGEELIERTYDPAVTDGCDVIIDMSASGVAAPGAATVIRVLCNGAPSELGAVSAVLDSKPVVFSTDDGASGQREVARPAIARRECMTEALDSLFSSITELVVERLETRARQLPQVDDREAPLRSAGKMAHAGGATNINGVCHILDLVVARLRRYLSVRAKSAKRWTIATRLCEGEGLVGGPWPAEADYAVVRQYRDRYFADPFLMEHGGRTYLFAEEFPFATGRGIISVAEIGRDNSVSPFRPVLERPYHLSYPFVFAWDDQIWMMPEASEGGSVELYRAVDFPHRWELDRKLIDGVAGCDATIFPFLDQYWMAMTATRLAGSTWDKMRLFQATSPLGQWREHRGGLVRIDSSNARPAGAALMREGKLIRPAQDSSQFYGGGMTLLEIRDIAATCLEVPVAAISAADKYTRARLGTHTYSKSRSTEAVDIYGELSLVTQVTLKCSPIAATATEGAGQTRS